MYENNRTLQAFNYKKAKPESIIQLAKLRIRTYVELVPDFINQWKLIDDTWDILGFKKHENNKKKIDDFRYINDCFMRYIYSKQDKILLNLDNPNGLKTLLDKYTTTRITPRKTEGWSDRFVVYITIRNAWLQDIANQVKIMLDVMNNKEE